MRLRFRAALIVFLFLFFTAGLSWWFSRPPVGGPLHLTPAAFADLPDWSGGDPRPALAAFRRSCAALAARPANTSMGTYAGTAADWREPCRAASQSAPDAAAARAYFEHWFAPLSVGAGELRDGLFTGYYEPQLRASRTRHGRYQTPVYGLPADLVTVDLGAFRDALSGERISGRVQGHRLVPYATRAEIDAEGLETAPMLFFCDDAVAVFFLHIQGSGRVRFDDGTTARVAYAGENGRRYTAIGRTLIAQGALARDEVSLQSIRAWLRAHPGPARAVMENDASFIFFRESPVGDPALGSPGAENVALTPGASIAVDARIHPLGAPFFVATDLPDSGKRLRRLFVAQDIGGAIRGPVRADIFWGFGAGAELLAGRMKQTGRLFVLLPKPVAARLAQR